MPQVNWEAFSELPGAATANFELLCRALMRRHYGRFGVFAARAAQPGVEFHLRLQQEGCALGEAGRWFGWQCRWYDLPGGTALGKTRRDKIAKAIKTTEREVPGVTDWVLWTRRPLTAGDQKWFYGLKTGMRRHLWTAAEVEEHLSGDAEVLRATYFGELVLTPNELEALHGAATATVRSRWLSAVHQPIDSERQLRRMLGEVGSWDDLRAAEELLRRDAAAVKGEVAEVPSQLRAAVASVPDILRSCAQALATAVSALKVGDLDLLRQVTTSRPADLPAALAGLPRHLRAARSASALSVTNGLATLHAARALLDEVDDSLEVRVVAVIADAGGGKTQLSAQLTSPRPDRPAGILVFGRDLHSGHNLSDLVRRSISIRGRPVASIDALLAALDAAGQRARCRIPLVIDGLNEAEDARDWRAPLSALDAMLRGYPYVLVVCTVRGAFADEALPSDQRRLEVDGFGDDSESAARRYFDYFMIDWSDAELPFELLRHPLTLRLFCEVTNPRRVEVVRIEKGPSSLNALFDRYLGFASERIAALAPRTRKYYEPDVRRAIDELGRLIWNKKTRTIRRSELQECLDERGRPWDETLVRALENEGVLLAVPGDSPGDPLEAIVYDALAGHIVASHLLASLGRDQLREWLNSSNVSTALSSPHDGRHPLASDIVSSLVALVPRRGGLMQLWQIAPTALQLPALRQAAELDGSLLDAATVRELASMVVTPREGVREILGRLVHTRGVVGHPLNAEFLDGALRDMAVAQRDARWTEWVRRSGDAIRNELELLESHWRRSSKRGPSDALRAKWVSWTLTSTVRRLRDQATRTLYWFGRGDLGALLSLAADSLSINDAYVPERVAAAAYGAAMALQPTAAAAEAVLQRFFLRVDDELVGPTAAHPTNHWLVRMYFDGIFAFASKYCPAAIPLPWRGLKHVPFAAGPAVEAIPEGDARAEEVDRTLQMDFTNYTIGHLVKGRRNYDMAHPGQVSAVAHVRGVAWSLGWRKALLGAIDQELGSNMSRSTRAEVERYGKKYGWAGYYTYAGILDQANRLPDRGERLSDVDIDPSFPEDPQADSLQMGSWTAQHPGDDKRWLVGGNIRLSDEFFFRPAIDSKKGPWIAANAFLNTREELESRGVFAFVSAMLVAEKDVAKLIKALRAREYPGNHWLPETPTAYYSFAGEIPWHPEFPTSWGGGATEYTHQLELDDGTSIEIEGLAHEYGWETYHSELNQAGGAVVASASFSREFDLRATPNSFDQMSPDGAMAAIALRAPKGLSGHVLYLREDLLKRYAAGRQLVWFAWGERELRPRGQVSQRSWAMEAIQRHETVWRVIHLGGDLAPRFAPKKAVRRRRRDTGAKLAALANQHGAGARRRARPPPEPR